MIDMNYIRDAVRLEDIDNVAHILSEHNPADSFTNMKTRVLQKICESGRLNHLQRYRA